MSHGIASQRSPSSAIKVPYDGMISRLPYPEYISAIMTPTRRVEQHDPPTATVARMKKESLERTLWQLVKQIERCAPPSEREPVFVTTNYTPTSTESVARSLLTGTRGLAFLRPCVLQARTGYSSRRAAGCRRSHCRAGSGPRAERGTSWAGRTCSSLQHTLREQLDDVRTDVVRV